MQAFIFHGFRGHPDEHWFRWLKLALENLGVTVFAPKFPTPERQSPQSWLSVLENFPPVDAQTLLIGHSLGATFILTALERFPAKSAFLVATPFGVMGNEIDEHISDFSCKEFNWDAIRKNCASFHVYGSDNDPYVPRAHGEGLAKKLGVPLTLVRGMGHFSVTAFPQLLDDVKKEL